MKNSCELFLSFDLRRYSSNKFHISYEIQHADDEDKINAAKDVPHLDFIFSDSYCTVAPDKSSAESLWHIKANTFFQATEKLLITKDVRLLLVSIKDTFRKKTDTITKECFYELSRYKICGTPFGAIPSHMKRILL